MPLHINKICFMCNNKCYNIQGIEYCDPCKMWYVFDLHFKYKKYLFYYEDKLSENTLLKYEKCDDRFILDKILINLTEQELISLDKNEKIDYLDNLIIRHNKNKCLM